LDLSTPEDDPTLPPPTIEVNPLALSAHDPEDDPSQPLTTDINPYDASEEYHPKVDPASPPLIPTDSHFDTLKDYHTTKVNYTDSLGHCSSQNNSPLTIEANLLDALTDHDIVHNPAIMESTHSPNQSHQGTPKSSSSLQPQTTKHVTPSPVHWTADASVSRLSHDILKQLQLDSSSSPTGTHNKYLTSTTQSNSATSIALTNQRIRFNLICHRYTMGDAKTVQLFRSFTSSLRDIDQSLIILPVNSLKQHISGLTNQKQILAIDKNKMLTYFNPYYKKQSYSLSGYFQISTSMTFTELTQHQTIQEWLEHNRFYIKLCPSQHEEMVQVGALCFSSIFIYREDLKQSILKHPMWTDQYSQNPPIFEIYPADLTGSSKKTKMLFISVECSKQQQITSFFSDMYDGSTKDYPNGAMMLFIPLFDGITYSHEQRDKIIFKHETFIGTEEAMCIGGLSDLNNTIEIKGGHQVSLRMLMKSMPATQGMSHSQLFQFVEPNISGVTTIVTFQSCDKPFIDARKAYLEAELRKIILPGEEHKVFLNDEDGIWFSGVRKQKNGKIFTAQQPSKSTMAQYNHVTSILHSPPKKRPNIQTSQSTPIIAPKPAAIPQLNTSHPTAPAQPRQTNPSHHPQIAAQFQKITAEFQLQHERNTLFDQHIGNLETTTNKIDSNVESIMSRLDILLTNTPLPSKKRKTSANTPTKMLIDEVHPSSLSSDHLNRALQS
jgi:hypothetical protein